MKNQNLFNAKTLIPSSSEPEQLRKKAKIKVEGNPRLEVMGKSKILNNRAISIGRDKTNSIIVADTKASRFHALVTFEKGVGYLRDSGSTNGTLVNGKQIPPEKKIRLNDGDKIRIGDTEITYHST